MGLVYLYRTIQFCSDDYYLYIWFHIALEAQWKNLAEMKEDFPSVDYVGNQRYVFNIRGNKYRLVVIVKFVMGYIFIRFVGTHKEYDKIDCSNI